MRVLFVQKRAHTNALGILRGLVESGHEVRQITFSGAPAASDWGGLGTRIVPYYALFNRIRKERKRHRLAVPRLGLLVREVFSFKPDLLILKTFRMHCLVTGIIGKLMGAQLVLFSDRPHGRGKGIDRFLGRFAPRCRIHAGWEGSPGTATTSFGGFASICLPYPVPAAAHHDGGLAAGYDRSDQDLIRILVVTNFVNLKKQPWILTEAIGMAGIGNRVDVTYIGTGSLHSVAVRKIRELENVYDMRASRILLNLQHSEVQEAYKHHDLFVLPSLRESFGAVVPEAMAGGLGVVLGWKNGARVCVEDGVTGHFFDSREVADLARVLTEVVRQPALVRELGDAARAAAASRTPREWVLDLERLLAAQRAD